MQHNQPATSTAAPRSDALRATALVTAALCMSLMLGACSPERDYVNPGHPDNPDSGPFSGAVMVGNTLYISGMLGLTQGADGAPAVPADPAEEARIMLDNIRDTLSEAGMTMDDLVSATIYCSDLSLYGTFHEVYRSYFTQEFPARAFIASPPLLFDAHFEMPSIAVKR